MIGIYIIIGAISIIWLLPPFKQRNTEYYQYFIIAATQSIVAIIYTFILKINVNYYYPSYYMLLLSTFYSKRPQGILKMTALLAVVAVPFINMNNTTIFCLSLLMAFAIFVIMLKTIIVFYVNMQSINVFHILFLLYISINIFRLLSVSINIEQGMYSYYAGGAVQIVFGAIFSVVNTNTKIFQIRSIKEM